MSSIDYSSNESFQEQDTVEWTAHLVKQLSAYTTWINSHLKKRGGSRQIHDLKLDIRDGVALIQLVELLSGEHLGGTVYPQSYHDMRENVQRVIDFMHRRRIRMHQTQASDIVEGNIKSIMRLILAVAVHYQPDSVKQSAHQQVKNQQSSQQSSSSEDRRNVDSRSRRNDVIRPEESHSDYANVDPRTFAGHTPAYVPNQYPRQGGQDPRVDPGRYPKQDPNRVDPRVRYDPRILSYDPRGTQRELRNPRDPRFDNFYDNRNYRNVPYETDLDRRTPTDFLDHNQGSKENTADYPQNSRRDTKRGSKDNLDYREKRNSRENLDWRENLRSRDQVDGRNYYQAPRQVKRRSRSREQLDQSDSESDNRAPRVQRSRTAQDPRATQDPRANQDSRYVVPWRVEPRGWSEKVRNVRAGGMVKSRSLDFDNVSSEESHSENSSAASAPRSVSIQPLTSTRVPNTPTSNYQSNQTTPSNYHSNVLHGTPDDGLDTPTNLASPIKGTPVKGTKAPVTSFASSRGPVIPYNPVVPYAPVVPSLDSTRAPSTPNAPAPSLASTGAHNTPVDAVVTSSLRHNDGGRVAPNTTMVQCTAPNTTMAEVSGAMFGDHSGSSSEGAMSDAMMNLLDNLDVDHSNMAGDLTETKQMLISLQSLLLDGDCDEMMPLQPGDEISPKEEMIILKNRLIQSEVSSQSLQDEVELLKAENKRLLQDKTTLEQKVQDQAEVHSQGQGQGHDNWLVERDELLEQMNQKETAIKELKRDLSYKDRLIEQLQTDLGTEIEEKENVSRQLKHQLTVLQEKMTRVGQSEAEISSKLANQDQAMTRIEGRMTSQRNNNQDPSYQEDLDHARELVRGLRSALSRNDPHHKAVDGLDGALANLGRQMALMMASGQGRKMSDPARRPLDNSEEPRCSPVAAVQGFPVAPHYHAKPYHPIPPRQYHDVTSTTQMTSQSSRGDVMSNVSKMSSSIKSAASNPNLSGQSYTSPNLTLHSHIASSHANLTSSSKGMKSMTSTGSVTSSTQSVTSSSHTKILYFTESTVTPFLCTIPKRLGEITLLDFKAVYDKPGKFRYHFKSMDPEFGTVKEEISADEDILPGWEGKVVAWIEEDQG